MIDRIHSPVDQIQRSAAMTLNPTASSLGDIARKSTGWFLALGIGLVVLGMLALCTTFVATLASMVFLGWLLMFSGVMHVISAFRSRGWKGMGLHLLVGLVDFFAGAWLVMQPLAGSIALTLFLAFWFIASGLFQIIAAVTNHLRSRTWAIISGVISLLLGISLWMSWPSSGLWFIGMCIGIGLIFRGWTWIALASVLRHAGAPAAAAPST
jgi:uncharacterized membrane protein HdeD (DUF308 family)